MKALKNTLALITLTIAIFFCCNLRAQTVTLSGKVFNKENTVDKAVFHIYKGDVLIDSVESSKSGKFKIKLAENNNYEVRINKEGFLEKRININMKKKNAEDVIPAFQFDVDLYKQYEFRYANTQGRMPLAAYIFYNEALGLLDWDRSITAQAQNQVSELKQMNKENRRAKFKSF